MALDDRNDDGTKDGPPAADPAAEAAAEPPPPATPEPPPDTGGPTLGGQVAAGVALLGLGGALLALERLDSGTHLSLLLILIGGLFVAGYLYRRAVGWLIPGSLLLGIGGGLVLEEHCSGPFSDCYSPGPFDDGAGAALGLGLGFLLIHVVSLLYERKNRWWPLIPGGFLVVASLPAVVWRNDAVDDVLDFWPVAVMAVGVILLVRAVAARRKEAEARRP